MSRRKPRAARAARSEPKANVGRVGQAALARDPQGKPRAARAARSDAKRSEEREARASARRDPQGKPRAVRAARSDAKRSEEREARASARRDPQGKPRAARSEPKANVGRVGQAALARDPQGPGLRFECTRCGRCCWTRGEYAHVYLSSGDVRPLASYLGQSVLAFLRRYTFVDGDGWRQLRFKGDRCVFLDEQTNLCTVYSARPKQCRTFPFWRGLVEDGQWTAEAERVCEGVGRGRLHSILEVEARIVESEL